jgi:2-polyprenyl-6-methoxyphenol hydroxylase-like FAD-dependent oxidoreductase
MIGQRAVVIGAGIAGLAAARALSDSFGQVVVLERDTLTAEAAPRIGVPQGRQPHALLVGGLRALTELFPQFVEQLLKSGAVAYDYRMARMEMGGIDPLPQRDLGIPIYSATRPLMESVVRRELKQMPNVSLQEKCRVEALGLSESGSANEVRYAASGSVVHSLSADLIIDASGRGAPTLKLLDSIGCAPCNLLYRHEHRLFDRNLRQTEGRARGLVAALDRSKSAAGTARGPDHAD